MSNNKQLSKEEIDRARYIVDTLHPLTDVPKYQAIPLLKPFKSFFTKKVDQERRNLAQADQLREEAKFNSNNSQAGRANAKNQAKSQFSNIIGNKVGGDIEGNRAAAQLPDPKQHFDDEEDPVNYLGFGIVSYFDLVKTMMVVFFVFTLLHIPVMSVYRSYNNYNEETSQKFQKTLTLGNMGFSTTKCSSQGVGNDKFFLSCKTGFVSEIVDFGYLTPSEDREQCVRASNQTCSNSFNSTQLQKDINQKCLNQQNCTFNGLKNYVTANKDKCAADKSSFFIQYYCKQSQQQLDKKYKEGSMISCISIFCCLFFIIMNFYLRRATQIKQVEWDVSTITAGDYTADMKITPQQYGHFLNNYRQKYPQDSDGFALKKFLKSELEDTLTNKVPSLGFDNVPSIKIADLQLSFKNGALINGLRQRGLMVKSNNWEQLKKTNENLDRIKTKEYQNLLVPVGVFITFESEEGLQRCLAMDDKKVQLLGQIPKVAQAPEPTNIIWENRQFTYGSRLLRLTFAIFVTFILLAISFVVIVGMKLKSRELNLKYQQQNCNEVQQTYGDSWMQEYAVAEWYNYYQPTKDVAKRNKVAAVVNCFCKQQQSVVGSLSLPFKEYTDKSGNKATICQEWTLDIYKGKGYGYLVSILINVVNTILRLCMIALITNIKEDTKSAQMRSIKVGVFLSQFFNTGILILLAGANLSETSVPFLNTALKGSYTDFNSDWYIDIGGTIQQAMVVSAFMPLIEFGMFWGMRAAFRVLDRSFKSDVFLSKKKSIQQYIDIYSGPEFNIHFRYSTIMNTTFVCLMYGTSMPFLYPLGLLAFVVLYCLERAQVCYYYKQPPMFDEKMTLSTLKMLLWAPIIYMAFSYWQLSNNQLFDNILFKYNSLNDILLSGHTVITDIASLKIDQSIPCLVLFAAVAILVPFTTIISAIINAVKPGALDLNLNIDENLGNYFESLEDSDKRWMIMEEENIRKFYGMKVLHDETLQKLKGAKTAQKTIQGVHCYDILANPDYISSFVYVPVDVPNRNLIIQDDDEDDSNDAIQCDVIKISLNMAMLKEEQAQKLSFQKDKLVQVFKK